MARLIEPAVLDDDGKLDWLATASRGAIFPTAFSHDDANTLIALLARKIIDLEQRLQELEASERIRTERDELSADTADE